MVDKNNEENILNTYLLLKVLHAELLQCNAYINDIVAKINRQIYYNAIEALEKRDIKMLIKLDRIVSSLDKLMQIISKQGICKTTLCTYRAEYNMTINSYIGCTKKCYFSTGILRAFDEYLKKINFIKFDKSYFEMKINNLIEVIEHLSSSSVLNDLYNRFEKKIKETLNNVDIDKYIKIGNLSDFKEKVDHYRNTYQLASDYIKEIIEHLLKSPKRNIEQLNKSDEI
ncbi:MAG: hypothetical protein ACO2ON_00800 [Candidatus Nanopusillus sp.]